jgi:hypothetical protein
VFRIALQVMMDWLGKVCGVSSTAAAAASAAFASAVPTCFLSCCLQVMMDWLGKLCGTCKSFETHCRLYLQHLRLLILSC